MVDPGAKSTATLEQSSPSGSENKDEVCICSSVKGKGKSSTGACVGEGLPEASWLLLMSTSMKQVANGKSKPKGCGKEKKCGTCCRKPEKKEQGTRKQRKQSETQFCRPEWCRMKLR